MFSKFIFLLLVLHAATGTEDSLSQLRLLFQQATKEQASAEKLKTLTARSTSALYQAYHGSAWCLMAKHHFNPYYKVSFLKKGLNFLNAAVTADANDIEIRFLRFSVEENIPAIVSFTSHIPEDKAIILATIKSSHPFYPTMQAYLKNSKSLSESEKKRFE